MHLTPDIVLHAPQGHNCLGDRALVLRNRAIPAIENLAVARDSFDTIDLSSNAISILGDGFPPFPRLKNLYLGSNRITKVLRGIADSLPSLHTLILTGNRIATRANLNIDELARFRSLTVLSLLDNPVAQDADLRLYLVHRIPSLRYVNFTRVKQAERFAAIEKYGKPKLPAANKHGRTGSPANAARKPTKRRRKAKTREIDKLRKSTKDAVKTFTVGELGENDMQVEKPQLEAIAPVKAGATKPQIEFIKRLILNATSVEEINKLQDAVTKGDIGALLQKYGFQNSESTVNAPN